MQLSCKRGIGFICVPKCGSTTIETYLRPHGDFSLSGNPSLKHIKYIEYEAYILPLLKTLRIKPPSMFAVVREPSDWVRSWYQFRKRDELADEAHPQHHNFSGHVSFDKYAELCMSARPPSFARIQSQFSYIVDAAGAVGVDVVFPLERVETAVPEFLNGFGITIKHPLKRKNISDIRALDELQTETMENLRTHFQTDYSLYHRAQADFAQNPM